MRERQSPIPKLLAAFPDVALSFAALPSADDVLSDPVAVERKTASDFVASILDGRLFGQTTKMQVLFARALLIMEGDLTQVPHSIDWMRSAGRWPSSPCGPASPSCRSAIPPRRRRCCVFWHGMHKNEWTYL